MRAALGAMLSLTLSALIAAGGESSFAMPSSPGAIATGIGEPPSDPAACASGAPVDPFRLYGDTIRFTVLRNGAPVGRHEVNFRREGETLRVETRFDVAVDVLFVTAYRYDYRATDIWRDGCLVSMQARVNDDGDRSDVDAHRDGGVLRIRGPIGEITAPFGIFPTHHWHPGVLRQDRVLNTITGAVSRVAIVDRGTEAVVVNGRRRDATRYAYTGDLQTDVWYDAQGRWVKMRFAGKDGSTIEYVCETCSREQTAQR